MAVKTILKKQGTRCAEAKLSPTTGYGKDVLWESMLRRWGRIAVFVEPTHPLLVLFWQVFFKLYFARAAEVKECGAGNVSVAEW